MSVPGMFEPRLSARRRLGWVFAALCSAMTATAGLVLGVLLFRVVSDGGSWLSWRFFTSFPSVLSPEDAGVRSAILGTVWLVGLTASFAVPVGVGSAVYLEEYATRGRLSRIIQLNINNLAGVPSIVYGILGLAAFVRGISLGRSILAGALTMALLVLPVVILASREAISAVPPSIRDAAYALGATRWQTVRHHVLPAALPGIMTGVILSLSRAIGEAAPLILLGAVTHVTFDPSGPLDQFTVLPIQIFAWCDQPQPEFHHLAAAGIIALLCILLPMNALAIGIRAWHQRRLG